MGLFEFIGCQILSPQPHNTSAAIVGFLGRALQRGDRLVAAINRQCVSKHQAHHGIKLHRRVLMLAEQDQCAGREIAWIPLLH